MNETTRLTIFRAQVKNARALVSAWKQLNRGLNASLLKSDRASVSTHTKLLLQVYCGLAEAVFSRTIHTPHGFTLDEIIQIQKCTRRKNITEGWKLAVNLGLAKTDAKSNNYRPNAARHINSLIDKFILDPSVYRNKIAHGQWAVALNSEGNAINNKTTSELLSLDVVSIYRYQTAFLSLAKIVEDIVESPNKAHMRDYWPNVEELEANQKKLMSWTVEKKVSALKEKKARTTYNVGEPAASNSNGAHGADS